MMEPLSIGAARRAIERAIRADVPIHLVGEPGVGKTELVGAIAHSLGLPLARLELAQCDPADLGGIPVVVDGRVVRLPIGPVAEASARPAILFLDEFSQAPPYLQGAALTAINERRAGDVHLHPGSRVILASNPPSSGAATIELAAPAVNRLITIRVAPTLAEVQAYLCRLGTDGSALRALGCDYAATLEVSPSLLQLSPPPGCVGRTWASPRGIVRGLQALAACVEAGDDIDDDPVPISMFAGAVGEEIAIAYLTIRQTRARLPSRAEIVRNPEGAYVPHDIESSIAVLGVIAHVAIESPCAAWIYAARLEPEIRTAAGRYLIRHVSIPARDSRHALAERARAKILGETGAMLAKAEV